MEIEKNYIFVHPLTKELEELKTFLEEDESNTVYEMESIAEFGQVIGIMDSSITFSSDIKKTQEIADQFADFLRQRESYYILQSKKTIPVFMSNKLKTLGVNKVLKAPISQNELRVIIDEFWKRLSASEIEDHSQIQASQVSQNHEADDSKITRIKNDYTEFSSGLFDNLQDKLKRSHFKIFSPFDNLQRRKVKELNLKTFSIESKIKNLKLNPSSQNSSVNAYKQMELKSLGGKLKNHEFLGITKLRPKSIYKEAQLKNMSGKLKNLTFSGITPKKRKNLNLPELENKRSVNNFNENEMSKLSGDLKNLQFVENPMNRKKGSTFDSLVQTRNVSNYSEDELKDLSGDLKNHKFNGVEKNKSPKKVEEYESEKKEKGVFAEDELGYLTGNIDTNPVEQIDHRRTKGFEEELSDFNNHLRQENLFDSELELKDIDDELVEWNSNLKTQDLSSALLQLKKMNVVVETHYKTINGKSIFLARDKKKLSEDILNLDQCRDADFVIIDYRDFKIKKRSGKIKLSETDEKSIAKRLLEENDINKTTTYYLPDSLGIEFYLLYSDLYRKSSIDTKYLIDFIQFCLIKNFEAKLSLFIYKNEQMNLIHTNDNEAKNKINNESYMQTIKSVNIPETLDDTFVLEANEFYYPYFEDGEKLGLAVLGFSKKENGFNLNLVESFIMALKGAIIDISKGEV